MSKKPICEPSKAEVKARAKLAKAVQKYQDAVLQLDAALTPQQFYKKLDKEEIAYTNMRDALVQLEEVLDLGAGLKLD